MSNVSMVDDEIDVGELRRLVSTQKHEDEIATLFASKREELLDAHYLAEISKPPAVGSLQHRMLSPDFFNRTVLRVFSKKTLKITEHEGKSYDWELSGKKVSVKSMHDDPFPRPYKRGRGRITKGTAIQLKNTKASVVLRANEFDYLLVTSAKGGKLGYGLYLFDYEQVREMLKQSKHHGCNEDGYDGKGQIKLFVKDRSQCLAVIEMDANTLNRLKKKYNQEVSSGIRNRMWLTDIGSCVNAQLALSES